MQPIKTGICSYGMSGRLFHAPFIEAHPGFELAGIVERHNNESRERYPHTTLYRSIEDMLENEAIELIVVNVPIQLHYEYAIKAIEKGKHIIVEKPFTVTTQQAQQIMDAAAKHGVQVIVYQNRRYDGDFIKVKEVIHSGRLGSIKEAEIRFDRYREEITYKKHKEVLQPGAGNLYDLGAHLIDQALQLFGLPQAVCCDEMGMRPHTQVDDYFEILLLYADKRVRLKATCYAYKPVPEFIIQGSNGSLHAERSDVQEATLNKGIKPSFETWCPAAGRDTYWIYTPDGNEQGECPQGNYMLYYDDVYKCLRQMAPNPVPPQDGLWIIHTIEKAKESAATGKVIAY